MLQRTYYEVLGVKPTATVKEIKKAYRKLARQVHPDHNPNHDANARFRELSEAYQTLIHPMRRSVYDQLLAEAKQGRTVHYDPHAGGPPPGTGEYGAWNAAFYSAWMSGYHPPSAAPDASQVPATPKVTTLMEVVVRFGQTPVPWVLVLIGGLATGALFWSTNNTLTSGLLAVVMLCVGLFLFLFRGELQRYRTTLKTSHLELASRLSLILAGTFGAIALGLLSFLLLKEAFSRIPNLWLAGPVAAAIFVLVYLINVGRRNAPR